jgi:uncharacterized membrane protein
VVDNPSKSPQVTGVPLSVAVAPGSAPRTIAAGAARLTSIDALRGAIMIVMALDHTRDFLHIGAMTFSPEDLTRTTPLLFFTRWITHICAPVFMFTAGLGAFLRMRRPGTTTADVSRFLWTRGLWLVIVELTIMRLAMNFTFAFQFPVIFLVLSALGLSMVALAALIHLPVRVLAAISIAVVALHNLLDGVTAASFGSLAPVWNLLHQPGVFILGGIPFFVAYPIVPWFAVMALGFCAGAWFLRPAEERQRALLGWGIGLTVAFVVIRMLNVYGDPGPWASQPSPVLTVMSFFRVTKYPPSLDFLLMTLGPALLLLRYLDRRPLAPDNPLVVIGRVPLFFYVLHFWLLHIVAVALAWTRYGSASFAYIFSPVPSMGGSREAFPADYGYPLWVTYVAWISVVLALYPLCRWFAGVKARRRDWWLGFI